MATPTIKFFDTVEDTQTSPSSAESLTQETPAFDPSQESWMGTIGRNVLRGASKVASLPGDIYQTFKSPQLTSALVPQQDDYYSQKVQEAAQQEGSFKPLAELLPTTQSSQEALEGKFGKGFATPQNKGEEWLDRIALNTPFALASLFTGMPLSQVAGSTFGSSVGGQLGKELGGPFGDLIGSVAGGSLGRIFSGAKQLPQKAVRGLARDVQKKSYNQAYTAADNLPLPFIDAKKAHERVSSALIKAEEELRRSDFEDFTKKVARIQRDLSRPLPIEQVAKHKQRINDILFSQSLSPGERKLYQEVSNALKHEGTVPYGLKYPEFGVPFERGEALTRAIHGPLALKKMLPKSKELRDLFSSPLAKALSGSILGGKAWGIPGAVIGATGVAAAPHAQALKLALTIPPLRQALWDAYGSAVLGDIPQAVSNLKIFMKGAEEAQPQGPSITFLN